MTWAQDELARIGAAEELRISTRRPDGSLRTPVTVWVTRDGEDLYVRSVNGRDSAWFRGARSAHRARIHAGGVERDVALEETPPSDGLDAVYADKYRRYAAAIIDAINSPAAKAATVRLIPEEAS